MSLLKYSKYIYIYGENNEPAIENSIIHPCALNSNATTCKVKGINFNKDFIIQIRFIYYKSSNVWNAVIGGVDDLVFYLEAQQNKAALRLGTGPNVPNQKWFHDDYYDLPYSLINGEFYDYRVTRSFNVIEFSMRKLGSNFTKLVELDASTWNLADYSTKFLMLGRGNVTNYPIAGSYWTKTIGGFDIKNTYLINT